MGLFLYVLSCKEPYPGTREGSITSLWKQALGSTIHCVVGDGTGIIVGAPIASALGLPIGVDLVSEYAAGLGFCLLFFQSLFMKDTMCGSYLGAVRPARSSTSVGVGYEIGKASSAISQYSPRLR